MLAWLAAMSHPDGGIAFFNDAAFGIAPENSELLDYAKRLGFVSPNTCSGITLLEHSGYARISSGPVVVIADAAEVGPDYLPGHAHADTLSFEFSFFGERVIVNSGTSVYGTGAERSRQRGTKAHSTICVEGENSSHVWGGFRVAQRADILNRNAFETAKALVLEAAHDGYYQIEDGLVHKRRWEVRKNSFVIADTLTKPCQATAIYHLHPDIQIAMETPRSGHFILGSGHTLKWECSAPVRLQAGTWHPRFGVTLSNSHLVSALREGQVRLKLLW